MSYERFKELTYEGFRELAKDESLSRHEKIGFPDSYRAGKALTILSDITQKLTNLSLRGRCVLDIGAGCGDLALEVIERCRANEHQLVLVDAPEMLALLPDEPFITKVPGLFPRDCAELIAQYARKVDAVLVYSVIQYVFVEGSIYDFVDAAAGMLADGGELLIGDIPNLSKRKRFFSSAEGVAHHQRFTGSQEVPEVRFNQLERGNIDDAVLLGLVGRCRAAGLDCYILPQAPALPMANRREDILARKP